MARKSSAVDAKVREFLRMGGLQKPAKLLQKAGEATQASLTERFKHRADVGREANKLLGELHGASGVNTKDLANKRALAGLLNWHKKLAGKKLPAPKAPQVTGGFFPWGYAETIVPPFDFAQTFPSRLFDNNETELAVSASTNGQMSASAVTGKDGLNGGSEYARVGVLFHPLTQGTLRVWATPTYSFEWWTNSLNASEVRSSGSVGLTVYGFNLDNFPVSTAGTLAKLWDETSTGQINLDTGFGLQSALTTELEVNSSLIYLVFVEVEAHVEGAGWPGSLAGSVALATVPSISYEFTMRPVLEG